MAPLNATTTGFNAATIPVVQRSIPSTTVLPGLAVTQTPHIVAIPPVEHAVAIPEDPKLVIHPIGYKPHTHPAPAPSSTTLPDNNYIHTETSQTAGYGTSSWSSHRTIWNPHVHTFHQAKTSTASSTTKGKRESTPTSAASDPVVNLQGKIEIPGPQHHHKPKSSSAKPSAAAQVVTSDHASDVYYTQGAYHHYKLESSSTRASTHGSEVYFTQGAYHHFKPEASSAKPSSTVRHVTSTHEPDVYFTQDAYYSYNRESSSKSSPTAVHVKSTHGSAKSTETDPLVYLQARAQTPGSHHHVKPKATSTKASSTVLDVTSTQEPDVYFTQDAYYSYNRESSSKSSSTALNVTSTRGSAKSSATDPLVYQDKARAEVRDPLHRKSKVTSTAKASKTATTEATSSTLPGYLSFGLGPYVGPIPAEANSGDAEILDANEEQIKREAKIILTSTPEPTDIPLLAPGAVSSSSALSHSGHKTHKVHHHGTSTFVTSVHDKSFAEAASEAAALATPVVSHSIFFGHGPVVLNATKPLVIDGVTYAPRTADVNVTATATGTTPARFTRRPLERTDADSPTELSRAGKSTQAPSASRATSTTQPGRREEMSIAAEISRKEKRLERGKDDDVGKSWVLWGDTHNKGNSFCAVPRTGTTTDDIEHDGDNQTHF